MKIILRSIAAACLSVPLIAGAQGVNSNATSGSGATNGVLPADQPRTDLERQQTQQNGQALKYGQHGSNDQGASTSSTTNSSMSHATTSRRSMGTSADKAPDASKSGLSNSTNTTDPTTTK